MKDTTITFIQISILCTCMFAVGYGVSQIINDISKYNEIKDKSFDGLRFEGNISHVQALKKANGYDNYSDWVCINVKGMTYERCVEVANHECAHEIWAEICEKNDELCKKGQELLNNYSK